MKIEMLYPEVCNLFGDISNIKYLKKCLPDAEIIKTEINSEPAFVTQDVDIYGTNARKYSRSCNTQVETI